MSNGFNSEDFAVFDLPDFSMRMPALKAHITPKLKELGEILTPRVSELLGRPMHPHVAQHLRRTVNPPVETWVAFSKEKKAYKPYVHFRVSARKQGIKVVVFLEDYADEKPIFGRSLKRTAKQTADYLHAHPEICAFEPSGPNGDPIPGSGITQAWLKRLGDRLLSIKGQHAAFAIPISKDEATAADLHKLGDLALQNMTVLLPILQLGGD